MSCFVHRNLSTADVPAPREEIWAAVSDPAALAQLTPLVSGITPDGDVWCWQLRAVSILGARVEPSFTEHMSFEDGHKITFEHRPPPGRSERGGADGVYLLEDGPGGGTHLTIDITLHVELPLPSLAHRAVERVMASMMARTGDRFAANLYARLGLPADQATAAMHEVS